MDKNIFSEINNWQKNSYFKKSFLCRLFAPSVSESVYHENLTMTITQPFLNISSSNFLIILLMTKQTWWFQILKVTVTLLEFCPFLYFFFVLFFQSIYGRKCSSNHLSSCIAELIEPLVVKDLFVCVCIVSSTTFGLMFNVIEATNLKMGAVFQLSLCFLCSVF